MTDKGQSGAPGNNPIPAAELAAGIRDLKKLIREKELALVEVRRSLVELTTGMNLMVEGLAGEEETPLVHYAGNAAYFLINARMAEVAAMQIDLEVHKNNLELLESTTIVPGLVPRAAETEPDYLQLVYLQAFSLVSFYVIQYLPGLSLIHFTINKRGFLTEEQLAEEFAGDAEQLRELIKKDPAALHLINKLAAQIDIIEPLLSWAGTSYQLGAKMTTEAKLRHFQDPDWNKLVGLLQFLGDLPEQVKPYPFLARHFRMAEDQSLEELVAEVSKEAKPTTKELPFQLPAAPMPRIPGLLSQK